MVASASASARADTLRTISRMLPSTDLNQKMRQLCPLLLLLALAGCASSGDWFHRDEPRPEPPTSQVIPQDAPSQAAPQATPEQKQFVSSSHRRSASGRRERERGRAHGLRDGILQNQLLAKSGRTIQAKMVRAF